MTMITLESVEEAIRSAVEGVAPGRKGWRERLDELMKQTEPINKRGRDAIRLPRIGLIREVELYGVGRGWSSKTIEECQEAIRRRLGEYVDGVDEEELEILKILKTVQYPSKTFFYATAFCMTAMCLAFALCCF